MHACTCGEPPIAVPAGAPGTDATLVPPETSAEDAPAALGESRTIIQKEQEQQKQENQALAKAIVKYGAPVKWGIEQYTIKKIKWAEEDI